MGWIIALWRRYFGGFDSKLDWLEQRGVQCVFFIALVFLWEFFVKKETAIISCCISFFSYLFFCKSHWYYFKCGTEDDKYIDEQEAKGRKPAMNWIIAPVNKLLGFKPRSKQYCFVGMMLRYTILALPVALFVGWKFYNAAFAIPFVYNAMFWVDLPKTRFCKSPTNWAEWFSGLIIGWSLI
ncbi:MAG: hypothetical protein IJD90_03655 [Clostridia bacterium]|nr:hypothetical protein [Clostridia bacterium]MBQ7659862.1 hypothetical protein [Alphaproteobacteria bacterium]